MKSEIFAKEPQNFAALFSMKENDPEI